MKKTGDARFDLMTMPEQSEQSKLAAARRRLAKGSYADVPGTGPAGETCKTCKHYGGVRLSRLYRKCELTKAQWTSGPGTDILASAPACSKWEKSNDET